MLKSELQTAISIASDEIIKITSAVNEPDFLKPFGEKWSIAQNILHLIQSVKGVNNYMLLPKPQIQSIAGTNACGESLNYESLVNKYLTALGPGVKPVTAFNPILPENPSKSLLLESFQKNHGILLKNIETFEENELDLYQIPHPLMHEITLREMIYFIHYHLRHHQKALVLIAENI